MHGQGRRGLATGTLAEFDHSYAGAIAELGYPTRSAPRTWRDEHERTGEVPAGGFATNPRHAAEMSRRALPRARQEPDKDDGGPWPPQGPREAQRVGRRARAGTARAPGSGREATPPEERVRVVAAPGARDGPAAGMAERHGAPGTAPYPRHGEVTGDGGGVLKSDYFSPP